MLMQYAAILKTVKLIFLMIFFDFFSKTLIVGALYNRSLYPCKPQFFYIKVGCKGMLHGHDIMMDIGWVLSSYHKLLFLIFLFIIRFFL